MDVDKRTNCRCRECMNCSIHLQCDSLEKGKTVYKRWRGIRQWKIICPDCCNLERCLIIILSRPYSLSSASLFNFRFFFLPSPSPPSSGTPSTISLRKSNVSLACIARLLFIKNHKGNRRWSASVIALFFSSTTDSRTEI